MLKLFRDGFSRNIITVLLVTVIIGSIFAAGVASAANFYFGETLQGLIGEFGEYDLILHFRQPTKDIAAEKLNEIIAEKLPGVRWKEGTSIAGKANFFLSFPDKYKVPEVWEKLDQYFGSIPGKSGWTIMLEPRLTIRGIPIGAQSIVINQIKAIEQIDFVFRNGSNLELVLKEGSSVSEVSTLVKEILKGYSLFTVYFPLGYQPEDTVSLGKNLAARLQEELSLTTSRNITFGGIDKKTATFTETMGEMKSFLLAYASQITVELSQKTNVREQDRLILGSEKDPLIMQVTKVKDQELQGIIIQGDTPNLLGQRAYEMDEDGQRGSWIGVVARIDNPKENLNQALDQSIILLEQLDQIIAQAEEVSEGAQRAVDGYRQILPETRDLQDKLRQMDERLAQSSALGSKKINLDPTIKGLNNVEARLVETRSVLEQHELGLEAGMKEITKSRQSIQGLLGILPEQGGDDFSFVLENTLHILRGIEKGYQTQSYLLTRAQAQLAEAQSNIGVHKQNLESLKNNINNLNNLGPYRASLKDGISSLDKVVESLEAMQIDRLEREIQQTNSVLERLKRVDEEKIISSLKYLQTSLPRLEDREIGTSVSVVDDYINQQMAVDQGLVILTDSWISKGKAQKITREFLGNPYVSTLTTQVGVVDTDIRGEVQRIISQVREILAALSALAFTLLVLILDQTTIMSSLAVLREEKKKGWLGEENLYGILVGGTLLTLMVVVTGAAIPYLYLGHFILIGAFLGYLVSTQCQSLSPVNQKEIMAGQALGLSYAEIMEQIVIPSAKPGFLKFYNQKKVKFSGKGGEPNA